MCGSANHVLIPPHPPTQCHVHSRMQKMTTVASLSDAWHLKQVPGFHSVPGPKNE